MDNILKFISEADFNTCVELTDAINNRLNDIKASELSNIPDYGELIPISEFEKDMIKGMFTSNDGFGYYATSNKYSHLPFIFFDLLQDEKVKKYGFTHILWFNK